MDAEIYELIKDMAEYWENNTYMNNNSKPGLVARAKAIKAHIDAEPEPAPTIDPLTVIIELLQDIKERMPEPKTEAVQVQAEGREDLEHLKCKAIELFDYQNRNENNATHVTMEQYNNSKKKMADLVALALIWTGKKPNEPTVTAEIYRAIIDAFTLNGDAK